MNASRVRALAICVCRDGGRLLVAEYRDESKDETFYRPLGGTIEFGERGEQAVQREFEEEIGAHLLEVRYLGMLENIYIYEGHAGHEIVLVYDGRLAEIGFYQQAEIMGDEFGMPFKVVWKRLDEFGEGKPPLYPDGLLDLLRS
jgi:8-oxo-dGTP pyrophosphatase MutT (NUDIX family)